MAVVGVLARVDPPDLEGVRRRLDGLDGVSTFPVDQPGKLGILIEKPNLDEAHAVLTGEIQGTDGIRTAWPVHLELE